MSKKMYTQEQLDHAIDHALKIGDHTLDELYGRKDEIERIMKMLEKEYETINHRIEALEEARNNVFAFCIDWCDTKEDEE